MSAAIAEVKNGTLSVRGAANKYCVPRSSLFDRVKGNVVEGCCWGKAPQLEASEEQKLIDYATRRSDMGLGFSKKNFKRYAGDLANKHGVPFKKGVPSEKWWRNVKKRNAGFSLRCPEGTSTSRHEHMSRKRIQ